MGQMRAYIPEDVGMSTEDDSIHRPSMRVARLAVLVLAAASASAQTVRYRPKLSVPESLKPFVEQLAPGADSFPEEKEAAELSARLAEWGARLRKGGGAVPDFLLAPGFK